MREKKIRVCHAIGAWAAVVMALVTSYPSLADNATAAGPPKNGLFASDPNHLWNRLHRALFVRTGADGMEYGSDQLDPLLWGRTKHLLEGPSHQKAIEVLDEFLAKKGETLIRDPLKRAVLQRDLWAVFDWSAFEFGDSADRKGRQELQRRLAAIIPRLALTKEEIDALLDNYEAAVRSREFQTEYDTNKPTSAFLPANLFSTNGPWVCVGLPGEEPIAPVHVMQSGGRSAFLVFFRTPGGREEATNYLNQFRDFAEPYSYARDQFFTNRTDAVLNKNLPDFPAGTTFALVRQAMLVDRNGDVVSTHLTESVQIRRYNEVHPPPSAYGQAPEGSQSMFEFLLSRERLFGGRAGGLRAVAPDEKEFLQFMSKGFDAFEMTEAKHEPLSQWMSPAMDCRTCHGHRGVYSVNSFLQSFHAQTATLPYVMAVDAEEQRNAARYWKEQRFSWGLLEGLSFSKEH